MKLEAKNRLEATASKKFVPKYPTAAQLLLAAKKLVRERPDLIEALRNV